MRDVWRSDAVTAAMGSGGDQGLIFLYLLCRSKPWPLLVPGMGAGDLNRGSLLQIDA